MAVTTQTIRVDLSTGKVIPTAYTHQNDTARTLEFSIYNKGVPYTMTDNTVKFAYKSPIVDGAYTVITGSGMASGTVSGNKVSVTLPVAYTQISGVGMLTMIITPTSGTVRPVNIRLVVQKSADGDDAVMGASDFPESLYDYMDDWLAENEPTEIANLKSDLTGLVNYYSNDYRPLYTGLLKHGTQVVAVPIAKGATYRCQNISATNTTYSFSLCTKDNTLIEQLGTVSTGIAKEFTPSNDSSYIRLYTSASDDVVTAVIECITDVPFRLSETETTVTEHTDDITESKNDIANTERQLNGLAIGLMNIVNSLAYVSSDGKSEYNAIMDLVGIKGISLLDGYLASAIDGSLNKQLYTKTRQTTDLYEIVATADSVLIKGSTLVYSVIRCYDEYGAFLGTATTPNDSTGIATGIRNLITGTKYVRFVLCNNSQGTGAVGAKYTTEVFDIEEYVSEQLLNVQKVAFIINELSFPAYIYDIHGNRYMPKPLIEIFNEPFNTIDNQVWSFRSGAYQNRYYMPVDYSQNAYTDDGKLVIKNIKNNPTNEFAWSGAFIESEFKYSFMYGHLDARIKFPSDSPKYHATLWMMGNNHSEDGFGWPKCGEIDVAEADDGTITCTVHYGDASGNHVSSIIGTFAADPSEYHVYSMEWTEKYIAIYCDDVFVGEFQTDLATVEMNGEEYNPFRQPFYIMFNCNPWGLKDTENNDADEVTCYIDYINIYE